MYFWFDVKLLCQLLLKPDRLLESYKYNLDEEWNKLKLYKSMSSRDNTTELGDLTFLFLDITKQ